MKKYILSFLFISSLVSAAPTPLEVTIADTLASYDIIVEQKATTGYRLGDTITRAEAVGVALKVTEVTLPEKYFCRNYFRDVQYDRINNWICRAIETASDYNIISRTNDLARPKTPISRIEALAIVMRAGKIPYAKNVDRSNYPVDMPQWEVDILEGALQYHIISSTHNFGPDMTASRIDVFGMIYNMRFAGTKMEYITDKTTPLPPLTSAPEEGQEGITITLPGKTTTTPPTTTPTTPAPTTVGPLNSFVVTFPKEVKVNTPFDIVVKALDKNGNTVTNYAGPIYFDLLQGSYSNFSLGINDEWYTFTPTDKWVMTFKSVVLKQAGTYEIDIYEIESGLDITKTITITATDGYVSTVTTQNATQVADFVISAPAEVKINTSFDVTVSAVNSAGQVLTNYLGTIYFDTNNLESDVMFPNTQQSYTFTAADKGKRTFTGGFKLKQTGNYELIVFEVDVIPNGVQKIFKVTAKN
jgi:hypothetical protein